MATVTDVRDALVRVGVDQDAASEIQRTIERRNGPSALSILAGATIAGFSLLGIGLGWVKSDVSELRTELRTELRAEFRTEISANRDRLEAVADGVDANSERLTRIEILLEERLPERR